MGGTRRRRRRRRSCGACSRFLSSNLKKLHPLQLPLPCVTGDHPNLNSAPQLCRAEEVLHILLETLVDVRAALLPPNDQQPLRPPPLDHHPAQKAKHEDKQLVFILPLLQLRQTSPTRRLCKHGGNSSFINITSQLACISSRRHGSSRRHSTWSKTPRTR